MTQTWRLTQGGATPRWHLEGGDPSLSGGATLTGEGFVLRVDAGDPSILLDLHADPRSPTGRAALDSWLGRRGVDGLLTSANSATITSSDVGGAARLLGELAQVTLLRAVDAGPRDWLWHAEMLALRCDLGDLDHRFRSSVDVLEIARAFDRFEQWIVDDGVSEGDSALTRPLRADLVALVERLGRFDSDLTDRAISLAREFDRSSAPLTLSGFRGRPRQHPEPGERSATNASLQVARLPIDRAHLPNGLQLHLDGHVTVLREGHLGRICVEQIAAWPERGELFLVGRTPFGGKLRTLDVLRFDGISSASVTIEFHESDFAEGEELSYLVVDRAGAMSISTHPGGPAFDLIRSELARLHLISAEMVSEFGTPAAIRLDSERIATIDNLARTARGVDSSEALDDAVLRAELAGGTTDLVAARVPRRLFSK